MSKLYDCYKINKAKNSENIVIIKSGNFYVMLDNDAIEISRLFGLKLTPLNAEIVKCGFPITSLAKYEEIFKAHEIPYIITELDNGSNDIDRIQKMVIDKISMLDINSISPMEALRLLEKYKNMLNKM